MHTEADLKNISKQLDIADAGGPFGSAGQILMATQDVRELINSIRGLEQAWLNAEGKISELQASFGNPPQHDFWGAGEADCPKYLKAPNGELHSLQCKTCGIKNPRSEICLAALPQ